MKYLIAAYLIIWIGFFLYLLRLQGMLKNLEGELRELKRREKG